jgi:hypothetical protein
MHKFLLGLLLAVFFVTSSNVSATFIAEEDLAIQSLPKGYSNDITEAEFKAILKKIGDTYSPIVSKFGGKLQMQGDWKSKKLNAGARQMFGSWQVAISGELARHPDLTADGFALIVCHELGHHLGGFPIAAAMPVPIPIEVPNTEAWAATEGQSDYFATQICAKKIWADEKAKNATFRQTAKDIVRNGCDAIYKSVDEQDLCYRTVSGVQSMIRTMANLMKKDEPKLETPDQTVVDKTLDKHPPVQCRLDTSFQGAICPMNWDESVIPGKKVSSGVDSIEAEQESARYSCTASAGFNYGIRPACWFKARL